MTATREETAETGALIDEQGAREGNETLMSRRWNGTITNRPGGELKGRGEEHEQEQEEHGAHVGASAEHDPTHPCT